MEDHYHFQHHNIEKRSLEYSQHHHNILSLHSEVRLLPLPLYIQGYPSSCIYSAFLRLQLIKYIQSVCFVCCKHFFMSWKFGIFLWTQSRICASTTQSQLFPIARKKYTASNSFLTKVLQYTLGWKMSCATCIYFLTLIANT